jgi:hypothetical protein
VSQSLVGPAANHEREQIMSDESVFNDLIVLFDHIPDAVRAEISLLLVALADDHPVESEEVHTCAS